MIDDEDDDEDLIHVYPLFGREHITNQGKDCWCQPKPLPDESAVLLHNVEH